MSEYENGYGEMYAAAADADRKCSDARDAIDDVRGYVWERLERECSTLDVTDKLNAALAACRDAEVAVRKALDCAEKVSG